MVTSHPCSAPRARTGGHRSARHRSPSTAWLPENRRGPSCARLCPSLRRRKVPRRHRPAFLHGHRARFGRSTHRASPAFPCELAHPWSRLGCRSPHGVNRRVQRDRRRRCGGEAQIDALTATRPPYLRPAARHVRRRRLELPAMQYACPPARWPLCARRAVLRMGNCIRCKHCAHSEAP